MMMLCNNQISKNCSFHISYIFTLIMQGVNIQNLGVGRTYSEQYKRIIIFLKTTIIISYRFIV